MRQANQIQVTGDEDAAEEFVPGEAVTKSVAEEADASTDQNKNHQ